MLKLLGALLLVGGAAFLGFSAAAALARRARTLRVMLGALELMEREIAFRLTPMGELFGRLAEGTPSPVGAFFARCRDGMAALGEKSLAQIWQEALLAEPMGLGQRELDTLTGLGELLGRYDGEGQREALAQVQAQLERDIKQAEDDREKRGRMYSVLGLAAGAFLVILLL